MENKGTNQNGLSEMNQSLILKLLQRNGICSRVELSKLTGLTQASITKIVRSLMEIELVVETGLVSGKAGRRSIGLELNVQCFHAIGVKVERGSFTVGVFDLRGKLCESQKYAIGFQQSPKDVIGTMKCAIQERIDRHSDILAIGMAVPGPYLRAEGKIALMTKFPKWDQVNFRDEFVHAFSIPLYIEHDANAGALANWWFGSYQREIKVLAHMLASEGVGAGIINGDGVLLGHQGTAGEIGHISVDVNGELCECGNHGCLELYCSSIALLKKAEKAVQTHRESKLAGYKKLRYEDVFTAMKEGDALATGLVHEAARYLGYGVVTLVNAYNPNIVVISDIMTQGGEQMLEWIRETVKSRIIPQLYENLEICFDDSETDPVLYGAAALVIDKFLLKPGQFLRNHEHK